MSQTSSKTRRITVFVLLLSSILALVSFGFIFSGQLLESDFIIFVSIVLLSVAFKYFNSQNGAPKTSFLDYYKEIRNQTGKAFTGIVVFFIIIIVLGLVKYGLLEGQLGWFTFPDAVGLSNFLSMINLFVLFGTAVLLIVINLNSVLVIKSVK